MSKETKKQIKAQMQNEFAKKSIKIRESYNKKIEELLTRIELTERDRDKYKDRALKAESELNQYKDWVNRLLEYMDMPKEQFEQHIKSSEKFDNILSKFSDFYSNFGIFKTVLNV
jgi:chromosome segregation ATPase